MSRAHHDLGVLLRELGIAEHTFDVILGLEFDPEFKQTVLDNLGEFIRGHRVEVERRAAMAEAAGEALLVTWGVA